MLKQIIYNDFITDLIQLNQKIIIMFLNTLKYMNDFKNSVIFVHVYCKIFINFIKIYEEELQYLLSDLNTEIIFCKLSMLSD